MRIGKFISNESKAFFIDLTMWHYLIDNKISLLQEILECNEFSTSNFFVMEALIFVLIKMCKIGFEMLEWEVYDQTHSEIVQWNAIIRIYIKLVEFVMP